MRRLILFADSCEAVLRSAGEEETTDVLKTKLVNLFDELIDDSKKEIEPRNNDEFVSELKGWLDDDMNFAPFRVGVNTLYHLADLHKLEGGQGVDKLMTFLDKLRDSSKLKSFVLERAKDIVNRGADDVVRHYVSSQAMKVARELYMTR